MAWAVPAQDVAVHADLLAEMRAPAVNALRWLWAPTHWWPLWLGLGVGSFLLREIWALATKHSQDTLSDWVWNQLHIVTRESITQWSAADLLLFIVYIAVFVAWLPWHFWFRKFT